MDRDDSAGFVQRLMTLAEIFDKKLSPQQAALYFEALRDLPFETVVMSLNVAVQTCKFFPRPAELRGFALGDTETQEESAWLAFRQAMRSVGAYSSLAVEDAALGEAIVALFGGWPQACSAELSPEMWASKRKEFGRTYRALKARNLDGSRYLQGVCEQTNAGRLEWLKHVPLGRIGRGGEIRRLENAAGEVERTEISAESHAFTQLGASMESALNLLEKPKEPAI